MNPTVTASLTLDHRRLDETLAALKRCAAAGDSAGALARLAELTAVPDPQSGSPAASG